MNTISKAVQASVLAVAYLCSGCVTCEKNAEACFVDGEATLDLTGEKPVFGVTGVSDDSKVPNALFTNVCGEGDGWQVHEIEEPRGVVYGVLPEGANEPEKAPALLEGRQYSFAFEYEDHNLLTEHIGLGRTEWTGSFTHGDPDSFVLGDNHCIFANAQSTVPEEGDDQG